MAAEQLQQLLVKLNLHQLSKKIKRIALLIINGELLELNLHPPILMPPAVQVDLAKDLLFQVLLHQTRSLRALVDPGDQVGPRTIAAKSEQNLYTLKDDENFYKHYITTIIK